MISNSESKPFHDEFFFLRIFFQVNKKKISKKRRRAITFYFILDRELDTGGSFR